MGNWFIYGAYDFHQEQTGSEASEALGESEIWSDGHLDKIPSSREDVVADAGLDLFTKRNMLKFLKLVTDESAQIAAVRTHGQENFQQFLHHLYKLPSKVIAVFVAITLSPDRAQDITTAHALPRIHRHLTSFGVFGTDFGAVISKWGGLSEIAQLACRAGAVGGGTYVLNKPIQWITNGVPDLLTDQTPSKPNIIELVSGEKLKATYVVGSKYDLPRPVYQPWNSPNEEKIAYRSIAIVSSPLKELFPESQDGIFYPAAAIVVFPTTSVRIKHPVIGMQNWSCPPIYLQIRSADTGECPENQSKCNYHRSPSVLA